MGIDISGAQPRPSVKYERLRYHKSYRLKLENICATLVINTIVFLINISSFMFHQLLFWYYTVFPVFNCSVPTFSFNVLLTPNLNWAHFLKNNKNAVSQFYHLLYCLCTLSVKYWDSVICKWLKFSFYSYLHIYKYFLLTAVGLQHPTVNTCPRFIFRWEMLWIHDLTQHFLSLYAVENWINAKSAKKI